MIGFDVDVFASSFTGEDPSQTLSVRVYVSSFDPVDP